MAPTGKKFEKVRLPEIAFESGCHYVACLTVSKPNRVEKVIRNAIYVAREFGPTYVQLYTPCILEIGKQSMEGLDEMKDSEAIGGRFVMKEFMTDEVKVFLKEKDAEQKARKKAAKEAAAVTA
jgi:pyruvate ferredoxin oxidoreductase beta subunit